MATNSTTGFWGDAPSATAISHWLRHIVVGQSVVLKDQSLPLLVLAAFVAIYATQTIYNVVRAFVRVGHVPGYKRPLFPYSAPGLLLPTSFVSPGYLFLWRWRQQNYKRFKSEVISYISLFNGSHILLTNNLDVMRQVAGGARSDFEKPVTASKSLILFGMNLAGSPGGEDWRKHRRIMGPSFSNTLYRLVWTKSADIYREMCSAEGWDRQAVVDVPVLQKYTTQFALLVIGICGFGFEIKWTDPPVASDGSMSIQHALETLSRNQVTTLFPSWVQKLPFGPLAKYHQAKNKLEHWMKQQAAAKKELVRGAAGNTESIGSDCFTVLVKANEDEAQKFRLTDEELIGNVFVLLFAGHDTTAQTFAATLANLAVRPDLQEEVLEQIISVVGWDRDAEFEDYSKLNKVLAVFYEALRMFPAGHLMFRQSIKDTILNIPKPLGEEGTIPVAISKDVTVVVDMIGVQYNDRYFDDPENYKPSRWYDVPMDSEMFSAFSLGPRACIGRKFATTEAVSFLTFFLRDWKVEPLLNPGETVKQWTSRVIQPQVLITLGIQDVPLRFIRRPERAQYLYSL